MILHDSHWVIYHDSAWKALVEQGYVTQVVETRYGQRWALMVKW